MVDQTFVLTSRPGLTFTPNVAAAVDPGDYIVKAVRPDGSVGDLGVTISWVHFNPGGFKLVCRAPGATSPDVPVGTSLWLE